MADLTTFWHPARSFFIDDLQALGPRQIVKFVFTTKVLLGQSALEIRKIQRVCCEDVQSLGTEDGRSTPCHIFFWLRLRTVFHGVTITSTMFHGMKRINLVVPDEFHDKLMAEKPVHKMLSSFCLDLIAAELDRVAKLAPCPAQAGKPEVHVIHRDECVKITQTGVEKTSLPSTDRGEVVGKGVQRETPKKGYPEPLKPFKAAIDAYWRVKQGSKSDTAWTRLMNNLLKFLDKYGKEVVEEQLGKAESGKWKGIELSNYESMQPAKKTTEPEPKHPAYRDFTAERLEQEAAANNILKELF